MSSWVQLVFWEKELYERWKSSLTTDPVLSRFYDGGGQVDHKTGERLLFLKFPSDRFRDQVMAITSATPQTGVEMKKISNGRFVISSWKRPVKQKLKAVDRKVSRTFKNRK